MHSSTHSTMYARFLKWTHIGKRSNNGGLFPWAKRELRAKTTHAMRKVCVEIDEWMLELEEEKREQDAAWGDSLEQMELHDAWYYWQCDTLDTRNPYLSDPPATELAIESDLFLELACIIGMIERQRNVGGSISTESFVSLVQAALAVHVSKKEMQKQHSANPHHEYDSDAVCVHCGFDGAEWMHRRNHTYEGRAYPDAKIPNCVFRNYR